MLLWLLLAACGPGAEPRLAEADFPAPDAFAPPEGPGGPSVAFGAEALWDSCASLVADERDEEHHNLVVMHDGYLWMPWAPEYGGGGISIYAFDDPCDPVEIGVGYSELMRESHSLSFGVVGDREYMAVGYHGGDDGTGDIVGGVGFFDVTDRTAPVWVSEIEVPDFHYPDAYFRVVLATFWQGDILYAAAGLNGVYILDVSDPTNPELIGQFNLEPSLLTGSFHVIGNVAMMSNAGTVRTAMVDVGDPLAPVAISEFDVTDDEGAVRPYYFANIGGEYALFAKKDLGGGPILYDIRDPEAPGLVGYASTVTGDGGYVFRHEDYLFQGDSDLALVYDMSDPAALELVGEAGLAGDLDTVTPIGNVAVLSVDEGGQPGMPTVVVPWQEQPDGRGPVLSLHFPADGAEDQPLTSRIGLSFDEMVESASVFEGSVRVGTLDGEPISGRFNVQENLVNFTPDEPLWPSTTYVVAVPAGGVTDISGNPTSDSVAFRFRTAR